MGAKTTTGFSTMGKAILDKLPEYTDVINKPNLNKLISGLPTEPGSSGQGSSPSNASMVVHAGDRTKKKEENSDDDDDDEMMSARDHSSSSSTTKGSGLKPLKWIKY